MEEALYTSGRYMEIDPGWHVEEYVEDYYSFLRALRPRSRYAIFHLPLELSVQTILRSDGLLATQVAYGHLHYFTAEVALQALRNAGYTVRDQFYTARALEIPTRQLRRRLVNLPRRVLFSLNQTLASGRWEASACWC